MVRLMFAFMVFMITQPAGAVDPREILSDPVLESRARELSKGLRCVVCQNQSIDDSDATLARDLRLLVRERLTAGDSNQQVLDYVVSRYGDFVLLKPPFKMATLALWLGPLLIAGLALFGGLAFFRRQRTVVLPASTQTQLSDDERKRLDNLLKDDPA
ncbi:MAG: cytochrome c-type biogenesis protein CcmH [Rhodospirillaceae bacterium]|jgi:cytochrome c-type biogenesis protein CcmH|nr:cytochrome c-type biogenesis protein CcmH [Rhodospirillaceae bacterium]